MPHRTLPEAAAAGDVRPRPAAPDPAAPDPARPEAAAPSPVRSRDSARKATRRRAPHRDPDAPPAATPAMPHDPAIAAASALTPAAPLSDAPPLDAQPPDPQPTSAQPTGAQPTGAQPTGTQPTGTLPGDAPPADAPPGDAQIEAELLRLCAARGPQRSFCPSEAARALRPDAAGQGPRWQSLMGPVRRVAFALARRGVLQVLRKGRVIDPAAAAGVIRLRATAPAEGNP